MNTTVWNWWFLCVVCFRKIFGRKYFNIISEGHRSISIKCDESSIKCDEYGIKKVEIDSLKCALQLLPKAFFHQMNRTGAKK